MKNKVKKVKSKMYVFVFEDKRGNELTRRKAECLNLTEAKQIARKYKANSMLNDLHKIVIKAL